MTVPTPSSYAGHRFPAEIISHAVWLYFRFPLSLRHVDEILAARGITVSHETVRQWVLKFGQSVANQIRRRLPRAGDTWHLDEVAVKIAGKKHWLWRAVDQHGVVLDILVQSRRDKHAAKRPDPPQRFHALALSRHPRNPLLSYGSKTVGYCWRSRQRSGRRRR
jgi:putative transposase